MLLLQTVPAFWEIIIGLLALLCFCVYVYLDAKLEECICENCGWQGPEKNLDSFSTEDQKLWFHFCPKCDSNKIIYTKKTKALNPVSFPGSVWYGKPPSMTDEECFGIPAKKLTTPVAAVVYGVEAERATDNVRHNFFLTAWKPNYEDLQALNRGEPVYIKTVAEGLPPMLVFTINEKGEINEKIRR